ncbi:MAG: MOSC domain-containing protein [Leptolyngbyaceae cyanobacterium SM1_3_5]|nr:MOSC domain-containing protein [Leptolyngbyaceae cyanobacterium SM1_3_5]
MSESVVGSIVSMWRYPVKSMLGEELNATDVAERGLMGDRAYALVDAETGKIISAKLPREVGRVFECRAALDSPAQVKITLPDGSIVMGDRSDINEILSEVFGRKVKLETAAPAAPSIEMYTPDIDGIPEADAETNAAIRPNTFFDAATVHLLTTATLNHFQSLQPSSRFEPRRFRPNFVIKPIEGASGFVENDWVGKTLAIGDQVRLSITEPCPRCVMTTMPQSELPNDVEILRTIVKHNQGHVGIYASVVQGGNIRRGDPVAIV